MGNGQKASKEVMNGMNISRILSIENQERHKTILVRRMSAISHLVGNLQACHHLSSQIQNQIPMS
ncbi:unnamed protein product [Trichobilharzia regenti]|nr:unnamed protein product [Trichobilharzia regenti]